MGGSSPTRRVSLCSIPRPVFDELVAREVREGIYRCRIVASLVTEGLIGAVVDREPRAVRQPCSGESLLPQDLKHLGVHRDITG